MRRITGFQISNFLLRKRLFRSAGRAFHMAELGRSGHGNCPLMDQPGQRNLRHADAMEPGQLRHALNDAGILRRGGIILALGVGILLQTPGGLPRQL